MWVLMINAFFFLQFMRVLCLFEIMAELNPFFFFFIQGQCFVIFEINKLLFMGFYQLLRIEELWVFLGSYSL